MPGVHLGALAQQGRFFFQVFGVGAGQSPGHLALHPQRAAQPALGAVGGHIADHPRQVFHRVPAQVGQNARQRQAQLGVAVQLHIAGARLAAGQALDQQRAGQAHAGFWLAIGLASKAIRQHHGADAQRRQLHPKAPARVLRQALAHALLLGQQMIQHSQLRAIHGKPRKKDRPARAPAGVRISSPCAAPPHRR